MDTQIAKLANDSQCLVIRLIKTMSDFTTPVSITVVAKALGCSYSQARGALASAAVEGWVTVESHSGERLWSLTLGLGEIALRRMYAARRGLAREMAGARVILDGLNHMNAKLQQLQEG